MMKQEFLVVLSTCPSIEVAEELARSLVEQGLTACVNILPRVRSIYRWKGAVHAEDEVLMVIKAVESKFAALNEAIVARHPYEVPEVVALPVADGHHPYLQWLATPDGVSASSLP